MDNWTHIRTIEDIEYLLGQYGGFHDSCLTELSYKSGAYVNQERFMGFGAREERELHVFFQSQWKPRTLELCFSGVMRYHIVGWQNYYSCDIFDCYLSLHDDLITGSDEKLVVWADNEGFSPVSTTERNKLAEPADSYIIALNLKWRFCEEE